MKRKKQTGSPRELSFKIDRERLLEFSRISPAGRLDWLEEANRFIAQVDNGRLLKKWLAQRGGRTAA